MSNDKGPPDAPRKRPDDQVDADEPKFIGKPYILEDTTTYQKHDKNFFIYESMPAPVEEAQKELDGPHE